MTLNWLRTCWQFYGERDTLRIFIFREGGEIVGLLPFHISRLTLGPLSVQVARLVGANIPPKVFSPLASGHGHTCLARAVTTLIQRDGCDLVGVGPVSTAWADTHQPETDLSGPPPGWVAQRQLYYIRSAGVARSLFGHTGEKRTKEPSEVRTPSSAEGLPRAG